MKRGSRRTEMLSDAEGARRAARGRRLRHRLLEPELPQAASRSTRSRSTSRSCARSPPRATTSHRHRGDQHGAEPQAARRRRGRGDARAARVPAGAAVRRGAGLLLQPAGAPGAVRRAPRLRDHLLEQLRRRTRPSHLARRPTRTCRYHGAHERPLALPPRGVLHRELRRRGWRAWPRRLGPASAAGRRQRRRCPAAARDDQRSTAPTPSRWTHVATMREAEKHLETGRGRRRAARPGVARCAGSGDVAASHSPRLAIPVVV